MTKITETVTGRLRELEVLTRPLEPDARERTAMTRDVTAHAEEFLSWMDGAPGYVSESVTREGALGKRGKSDPAPGSRRTSVGSGSVPVLMCCTATRRGGRVV